jgi:hypothetical protein
MKRLLILAALALASCSEDPVATDPELAKSDQIVLSLDVDTLVINTQQSNVLVEHGIKATCDRYAGKNYVFGIAIDNPTPFDMTKTAGTGGAKVTYLYRVGNPAHRNFAKGVYPVTYTVSRVFGRTASITGYILVK